MVGHDYLHSLSSSSASCPRKAGWAAKSDRTAPNAEAGRTGTAGAPAEDREPDGIVVSKFAVPRLRLAGSGLYGSAAHRAARGPIKTGRPLKAGSANLFVAILFVWKNPIRNRFPKRT